MLLPKLTRNRLVFLISIYCFPYLFCCGGRPVIHELCGGDEAFQCGSIRYIGSPFWGGNRPISCGHSGFELICRGNFPILNISSMFYIVRKIDFHTNTLTVAREDLWNTTCPTSSSLRNTTIDPALFQYSSDAHDMNATLFYDCTGTDEQEGDSLPNKFYCGTEKHGTFNVYAMGDDESSPGPNITCHDRIYVPVNKDDARSLENPTQSSINILQAALAAGFSIQWREFPLQREKPFCNRQVYGSCLQSEKVYRRPCAITGYCSRSSGSVRTAGSGPVPIGSPAPAPTEEESNAPSEGFPPVETGAFSPRPEISNISTTGTGLSSRRRGSSSKWITLSKWIIFGLVAGIIAILIMGSITIYGCRRRRELSRIPPKQNRQQMLEKFFLEQGSLAPKRYKHHQIRKMTKNFTDKLGKGGFGSVYKGVLPDGCPVAVKVLTEIHSDGEEFINEVASISRTSHINIINLLGFCHDKHKRALIYEYMPNRSLDKFIGKTGSSNEAYRLDLEKLYKIALGVAKGLEYLHNGCNTRIVHFDIKPQNILLDEDLCPKISDFGLAKLCKKKQSVLSMLGARGTIGYIAPEIFSRNFGRVSHKSDVYSYGMMVLDMVGTEESTEMDEEGAAAQSSENYFPDKIYEQLLVDVARTGDEGVIIEEQEERRRKLLLVGLWCIQTMPVDRPTIQKVIEMLEGSLESIEIPPKPFLFHPIMLSDQELSPSLSMCEETKNSNFP